MRPKKSPKMGQTKAQRAAGRRRWVVTHRAAVSAIQRRHHLLRRTLAMDALGNQCAWCRTTETAVLQIDHRRGGGSRQRHETYATMHFKDVVIHPKMYQLLCANCHVRKTRMAGEYMSPGVKC